MFFERNFRLLIYGPQLNNFISKPVEESEFHAIPQLFEYMVEVMRRANGCGLAAPQIGCFKNFVLVELLLPQQRCLRGRHGVGLHAAGRGDNGLLAHQGDV